MAGWWWAYVIACMHSCTALMCLLLDCVGLPFYSPIWPPSFHSSSPSCSAPTTPHHKPLLLPLLPPIRSPFPTPPPALALHRTAATALLIPRDCPLAILPLLPLLIPPATAPAHTPATAPLLPSPLAAQRYKSSGSWECLQLRTGGRGRQPAQQQPAQPCLCCVNEPFEVAD